MAVTKDKVDKIEVCLMKIEKDLETIHANLITINENLVLLNTSLFGNPHSEDKGLYGKVVRDSCRIDKLERILWPLVAVLIATNVLSVSSLFLR